MNEKKEKVIEIETVSAEEILKEVMNAGTEQAAGKRILIGLNKSDIAMLNFHTDIYMSCIYGKMCSNKEKETDIWEMQLRKRIEC